MPLRPIDSPSSCCQISSRFAGSRPTPQCRAGRSSELVTVATFPSVVQAQVAQGVLDEVGIESVIQSDNAGGMYPSLDAAALLVRSEDLEAGQEALNRRHGGNGA